MKAKIAHSAHSLRSPHLTSAYSFPGPCASFIGCVLTSPCPLPDLIGPSLARDGFGSLRRKLSHSKDQARSETRACTRKIANGESDLINVRLDALWGLKSDIF